MSKSMGLVLSAFLAATCAGGCKSEPSKASQELSSAGPVTEVTQVKVIADGYPGWPNSEVVIKDQRMIQEMYDVVLRSQPERIGGPQASDQTNYVIFQYRNGNEVAAWFGISKETTKHHYGKEFDNYFRTHRP